MKKRILNRTWLRWGLNSNLKTPFCGCPVMVTSNKEKCWSVVFITVLSWSESCDCMLPRYSKYSSSSFSVIMKYFSLNQTRLEKVPRLSDCGWREDLAVSSSTARLQRNGADKGIVLWGSGGWGMRFVQLSHSNVEIVFRENDKTCVSKIELQFTS